jgi:hypothetical protein
MKRFSTRNILQHMVQVKSINAMALGTRHIQTKQVISAGDHCVNDCKMRFARSKVRVADNLFEGQ